ncbi:hypothetical protein STIAU_7526 [Stigmatella aurantiaca DW4/3-1]|uniref:Uncharacterized protein n=1 Tax=Stigmatella aurantiaca (strain DW4/3-1) TaxID=378806 RepID=Q094V3_STIAD|nr:hypothetical protein STIAU_7526 [Stigmatella aurantiaca DW4/3-1]
MAVPLSELWRALLPGGADGGHVPRGGGPLGDAHRRHAAVRAEAGGVRSGQCLGALRGHAGGCVGPRHLLHRGQPHPARRAALISVAHADGELAQACPLGELHDLHDGAVRHALVGLNDDDGVRVVGLGLVEGTPQLVLGDDVSPQHILPVGQHGHGQIRRARCDIRGASLGQVHLEARLGAAPRPLLDDDRAGHHEDDEQHQEEVGEGGDVDLREDPLAALIVVPRYFSHRHVRLLGSGGRGVAAGGGLGGRGGRRGGGAGALPEQLHELVPQQAQLHEHAGQARLEIVVEDHRHHGHEDAHGGGDQRLGDARHHRGRAPSAPGFHIQSQVLEGAHDAGHGAEQAHEGGERADGGQEPQVAPQPQPHLGPLPLHGRFHAAAGEPGPLQPVEPGQEDVRHGGLGALGGGAGRGQISPEQVFVDGLSEDARVLAHPPEGNDALDGDPQRHDGGEQEDGHGDAAEA